MSNSLPAGFMRKRGTIWGSLFLLWLAIGIFSAGTILVELPPVRRIGPPPPGTLSMPARTFLMQLATWVGWALLGPAALWLQRRWPVERGALRRALPIHIIAIVLLCASIRAWSC